MAGSEKATGLRQNPHTSGLISSSKPSPPGGSVWLQPAGGSVSAGLPDTELSPLESSGPCLGSAGGQGGVGLVSGGGRGAAGSSHTSESRDEGGGGGGKISSGLFSCLCWRVFPTLVRAGSGRVLAVRCRVSEAADRGLGLAWARRGLARVGELVWMLSWDVLDEAEGLLCVPVGLRGTAVCWIWGVGVRICGVGVTVAL